MRNTGLDEAQVRIKIAGRNISNFRYADDTTIVAESKEELKSLFMRVKEDVGVEPLRRHVYYNYSNAWHMVRSKYIYHY